MNGEKENDVYRIFYNKDYSDWGFFKCAFVYVPYFTTHHIRQITP